MKLSNRLEKLKKRLFEVEFHNPGIWHFEDVNILNQNPELISEALVVRKALAQYYIGEHLPATIKNDELIVGNPNQNSVGWGTVLPKYYTNEEGEIASRYELNECSVWGHHPPAWDKVINNGTISIREEINEKIDEQLNSIELNKEVLNEYRAMLIALDGLDLFAKRHSRVALKMALECNDKDRKLELMEIYKICMKVPYYPADTFHEALQSYWFTYCMINSGGEYVPLARTDQYLYPYYKKDIEENKITKEHALDLMGSFLVKCNERIIIDTKKAENHYNFGLFSQGVTPEEFEKTNTTGGYAVRALTWQENESINSEANFNYGQSGNDWLMNCIVAGQTRDGTDATNELSFMIVELMHKMKLLMPTLSVRVHKKTPEKFYDLVSDVLRYGQGEPMIYNDETIIPGFIDLGIPIEDARDYSNDGCWETLIPGKSHFSYVHIMNLQLIEWILFRGVSNKTGEKEGLDTGDPTKFKSFDEFYEAYLEQMRDKIDFQARRRLANFGLTYMIAPDPLMSAITLDCVKKGKDISQDGAKYIFHLFLITGLANTVDALATIKKLVFEKKIITMEELTLAIKDNWNGHEKLRAMILNKVPKFGNDNDYVDELAVRLLEDFEEYISEWNKKQDTMKFPVGIGTFENYAALGRDLWASPDGRFTGDPLAPNYSPTAGADKEGPTAIIKSVTKPELLKYYCGTPVDLSLNSNEFQGDGGIDRMKTIIKSFCNLGGQMFTITSTSVEDLEDAKVNPERHRDLRVRMGGLSAYFITMSPVQQENIIKRFKKGIV